MKKLSISLTLPLLAVALPPQSGGHGQDPSPTAQAQKKLEAWPELERADRDRLFACLPQFRKDDESLHASAHEQLVRIGEGGMPLLFQKVSDQPDSINDHLFRVFDEVLTERHAALMAQEVKKPRVELRRYLVMRLCRFADPDMRPLLTATRKDPDELTAYYAAIGAVALGEAEALPEVLTYSKTHWSQVGDLTAEVLAKARSVKMGNQLFERITKATAADQMAGLRLARYLAVKEHSMILRTYLQAADHAVKKEAINACRVIHGEKPLENLAVFQAIGMAKEWLGKL